MQQTQNHESKQDQKTKHSIPCAKPRMCITGKAGTKIKLHLEFLEGRLHLPIIKVGLCSKIMALPAIMKIVILL
jgi:hypothetical protein